MVSSKYYDYHHDSSRITSTIRLLSGIQTVPGKLHDIKPDCRSKLSWYLTGLTSYAAVLHQKYDWSMRR